MKIYKNKIMLMLLFVSLFAFTACNEQKSEEEAMETETTEIEAEEMAKEESATNTSLEKEEEMKMEARSNSIAAKAADNDELSTLETALEATKLDAMLSEPGNYTVFAPSENAFNKLPEGTLSNLLKDENSDKLKSILQYHVIDGKITSDKLVEAINGANGNYSFSTLSGNTLTASMKDSQIIITDESGSKAQVVQGNVDASNGIIHIIDNVLMTEK